MGTHFSENWQRLYAFLTFQRASSGVLNHIYWSRLPKLGLAFTTTFYKWYFFLSEISMIDFCWFLIKNISATSPKTHCTCADKKIGHNSFFDINCIFSRVLTKICIANQSVDDFSDYKQWILCDKTETLSKGCVTLSQFGALNEETIELKCDKKRIQNDSIFLFFCFFFAGKTWKSSGQNQNLTCDKTKHCRYARAKLKRLGAFYEELKNL